MSSKQRNGVPMLRTHSTALFSGILTLGVEIVVGRLMAPFFGSSLHQWAALIGVVLLAYVLGYGSYRVLNRRGPFVPFLLGGLYVLSLPIWLFGALDWLLTFPLSVASVLGAFLSAGIPSVLWASVLPYLQARGGADHSAKILSWSAIGNLIGAWGLAFLAVPYLGTRVSLFCLGGLAGLLAILWWKEARFSTRQGLVVSILSLGVAVWMLGFAFRSDRPLGAGWKVTESPYQQIAVWDEVTDDGVSRRGLSLNGSLQFLWNESERLTLAGERYEYYNYSTAAPLWVTGAQAKSALILGLGGGLIPWQLRQFFPDLKITSFELDPEVVAVAQRDLPLSKVSGVEVRVGDGRQLLKHDNEMYDYVLLDTFLNSYVPFHLTTREFFELVRARMNPGAVLVANFHTVFASSGLLPKLEATLRSVFPSVGVVSLPSGTTLVLAAPSEVPLVSRLQEAAMRGAPELATLSSRAATLMRGAAMPSQSGDNILTDDRNDTEQRLYETRKHIVVSRPI